MARADLTRGPIVRGIVAFALPLLFTSVVQQLYSTVDLLFVGNALGTQAAAALGVGVMLINMLVALFTGLSTGATVCVAQLCARLRRACRHRWPWALWAAWLWARPRLLSRPRSFRPWRRPRR